MTGEATPQAIFLVLLLVLPLAALVARRVPVLRVLAMLAVWAGVFAGGLWLAAERDRFAPLWNRVAAALDPDEQRVAGHEVRIAMSADGHFWARASINGVRRRLLIDSGATVTALSDATAAAAGVKRGRSPFPTVLRTANGDVVADTGRIAELRLGDIAARDLAVVVSPAFGDTDVLGMNFLSRLKAWRVEGRTLILTPHHSQDYT